MVHGTCQTIVYLSRELTERVQNTPETKKKKTHNETYNRINFFF